MNRAAFEGLVARIARERGAGEHFRVALSAEESQFVRFNGARVRQAGGVRDAELTIDWLVEGRPGERGLREARSAFTVTEATAWDAARAAIARLRDETRDLPVNLFAEAPAGPGSASEPGAVAVARGELLDAAEVPSRIASRARGADFVGIYAGGSIIRGAADSAGRFRWFETDSFCLDYSLFTPGARALKGAYAGGRWDDAAFAARLEAEKKRLELLEREPREIKRGSYRAYLAPAAVEELARILSWGCIGEAAIRQSESPFRLLRDGSRALSPLFSLSEDFRRGDSPRFNSEGELAPEHLPLVESGKLVSALVHAKTAREYGIASNGAEAGEGLRSPSIAPGDLPESEALARLGTGLYLSNLHYLGWSDQPAGRVTGMTRYACFWVEEGKLVSPIQDLRFDDSLFSLFGGALEALTRETEILPNTQTYGSRQPGSARMPGALVGGMAFTL